jgi:hypothetical protein
MGNDRGYEVFTLPSYRPLDVMNIYSLNVGGVKDYLGR